MRFRHLPVLSDRDTTADLEQLQALLVKLAAIEPAPADSAALKAILQAIKEG